MLSNLRGGIRPLVGFSTAPSDRPGFAWIYLDLPKPKFPHPCFICAHPWRKSPVSKQYLQAPLRQVTRPSYSPTFSNLLSQPSPRRHLRTPYRLFRPSHFIFEMSKNDPETLAGLLEPACDSAAAKLNLLTKKLTAAICAESARLLAKSQSQSASCTYRYYRQEAPRRDRGEPVGTCTLLGRLKGGGFALKASGSEMVVVAGLEPALAAISAPCLCQIGLHDQADEIEEYPRRERSTRQRHLQTGVRKLRRGRSRNCTRTIRGLNSTPLLVGLACAEENAPGRTCTDTARGLSPLPLRWATGASSEYGRSRESGPGGRTCTRTGSLLKGVSLLVGLHRGFEK
jgi:hypothetical protein